MPDQTVVLDLLVGHCDSKANATKPIHYEAWWH